MTDVPIEKERRYQSRTFLPILQYVNSWQRLRDSQLMNEKAKYKILPLLAQVKEHDNLH